MKWFKSLLNNFPQPNPAELAQWQALTERLVQEESRPREIKGKQLKCQVCNSTDFVKRIYPLHTFLESVVEAALPPATYTLICTSCSHMHWFQKDPEEN